MIREVDGPYFTLHAEHSTSNEATAVAETTGSDKSSPSPADLKRRVVNFLATRNRPGLRQLEVHVEGGVVVLKGRVRSFYEKQLASHCCSRVAGVIRVVDGIHVIPEPDSVAVG